MVATSGSLPPGDWNAANTFKPIPYEKIVGLNNLLSVAWLSQGLLLAGAVARIRLSEGFGTGFMISSELLMTNHHVLPDAQAAAAVTVEFNYQNNWSGVLQPVRAFTVDSLQFQTNEDLDYTIVRVNGAPGELFGYLDLTATADASVNDYVSIIQHPLGGPKQICLTDNKVSAVFDDKVQYATDTEPGSSGAPVFNQAWQLVALHHAGGGLAGPDGTKYFTNEGIAISAVLADAADFLGLRDPVYDLAFGELRGVLVNLIDLADPPMAPLALLPDILWTRPAFAAGLDQWRRLNGSTGDPVVGIGAAGVSIGAALRQWARTSGHESIKAASPSTPPPPDRLVAKISRHNGTDTLPRDVYVQVVKEVLADETLLPAGFPSRGEASDRFTVTAALAFLTGVTIGGAAFDPLQTDPPSSTATG
jgi:V8-like Glu-specific endopeptidase